ncbi:MAG TPA: excisionase family DNA-binding protein [Chlamydiales bacterium]|nr:excisionase family DNA-binding protein [Chlamydiales bacterium]
MAISTRKPSPVLPKTRDIHLAESALAQMGSFLSRDGKRDVQFSLKRSSDRESIEFFLTPTIVDLIFRTILHISKGDAVTIVPFHAELTTQEAANFLQVSRPYLIKLLEKGLIPFHKTGRHRRILFVDIVKYKEKSKEKSAKSLDDLTKDAQELDLGY